MIVTSIWIFLFISITRRALKHLLAVFNSRSYATHISSGNHVSTPSGTSGDNDNRGSNNNVKANALHLKSK